MRKRHREDKILTQLKEWEKEGLWQTGEREEERKRDYCWLMR
jgi:hypothetical protein